MSLRDPSALVIFDCDGVLVDTEKAANELLVSMLKSDGVEIDYPTARRDFVGKTLESVQALAEARSGVSLGEDWPERVRLETIRVFDAGVEAIPGVADQIAFLHREGVRFCVASSGRVSKMQMTLGQAGLLPELEDVLFSAEMVGKGKPAPDLFLFAAETMGAVPHRCVVIEDSVPGVEAGVAAGMRVLGYGGDPHTEQAALRAAGAELFDDMQALPRLLGLE